MSEPYQTPERMAAEQRAADAIEHKVDAIEHGRRLREQYGSHERGPTVIVDLMDLGGDAVIKTRAGKFRLTPTASGVRVEVIEGYLRHHERLVVAQADHASVTFEMSP